MKKTIEKDFANIGGGPIIRDLGLGNNPPGQPFFANDSRFVEDTFSEPLTSYSVAWKDGDGLKDTLEFIAPMVPSARRFEFMRFNNAEAFMTESDDIRGVGQISFKLVDFSSEKVLGKTINKGLGIRVDEDNVEDQPNWRERYTGLLMNRLTRNELRRATTYLLSAGVSTAKTWSSGAVDPDQDLMNAAETFAGAGSTNGAGIYPNRVVMGSAAWVKRRQGYRAQNVAGAYASAGMSPAEVAQEIQVDEVYVSKERYQSANTVPVKSQIFGNYACVFLARKGMSLEDPSSIKRFVSSTAGGTPFRVYEQRLGAHVTEITVEHYSNIVITSNLGIQTLAIS